MHVWQEGGYFVQSHIYWGFLICILTGMRTGGVGQLKCADIRTDGEFYYFDLRPFDARNGRVALKDLRNRKTNAGGRVIPIHPLLIELGLLDRMQELMDKGEERLFPEWNVYVRKDGGGEDSAEVVTEASHTVLSLDVADDRIDSRTTHHLAPDGSREAAELTRNPDPEPMRAVYASNEHRQPQLPLRALKRDVVRSCWWGLTLVRR